MAKADDNLDPWRALYDKLEVRGDDRTSLPRPTAKDLDRFEAETGVVLPAGYRGFIQVFGPGMIKASRNDVLIRSPYCRSEHLDLRRAVELTSTLKTFDNLTAQARRLFYFSEDFTGGSFGWDAEEATDPDAPEFVISALYRGQDGVNKMANTFAGFIKICLSSRAFLEHQKDGTYKEDPDESDFGFLDELPKKKGYERSRP